MAHTAFHIGPALSKIQAPCQFPHNQHVKTALAYLRPQRTSLRQLAVQNRWTQIGKQPEFLPDFQKPRLRPFIRRQLIPGGFCGISSDGSHQHRVRSSGIRNRLLCQRHSMYINGRTAHQYIFICNLMAIYFCHLIQHSSGLGHNFRTDTVSRYTYNIHFHPIHTPDFPYFI